MDGVLPYVRAHPYRTALLATGATALGGYAFLKSKSEDIPRDLSSAIKLISMLRASKATYNYKGYQGKVGNWTTSDVFKEVLQKYGPKEAIVYMEEPYKGYENAPRRSELGFQIGLHSTMSKSNQTESPFGHSMYFKSNPIK